MWLRPSGGILRISDPVIGSDLRGDAANGHELGNGRTVVPGDYELVGFGSVPVELQSQEGAGIAAGAEVFVIDVEGTRVVVRSTAGEPVKSANS